MYFDILGEITEIEIIATGKGIRILSILQKQYGAGRWRKLKGFALVQLPDGSVRQAEIHWFEAHGIGKKKIRIKRFMD